MMHLSKNIRLIRQLSKKSQTAFGELFGATKAMIISYEKGKAQPDELFLNKLSKMADVTESQLKNEDLSDKIQVEKLEKVELKGDGSSLKVTVDRDKLIIEQQKEIIKLNAKVNIVLITLAELVGKVDKKLTALADGELTEAINRETKVLLEEFRKKASEL